MPSLNTINTNGVESPVTSSPSPRLSSTYNNSNGSSHTSVGHINGSNGDAHHRVSVNGTNGISVNGHSTGSKMPKWEVTEDVVISGIAGRFPESDSIQEFRDHLMNGDDMVTDDERRWPSGIFGLPTRTGKLKDLSRFDATFFGVHAKQVNNMDPQIRMLLELTHEAIVDSGYNPHDLRGKKVGVFIGASNAETYEGIEEDPEKATGYLLTGCCRAMFANRVSYSFDFKGPSYTMDTACSSSLLALDQAMLSIRTGQCDAAIVGGVNLCLKPQTSINFNKLGMLSPEGKCKAFDASANGYVRSEAAVVIFLQKASCSRRLYATVVHSKSNTDGYKEQGITYPSGDVQKQLILDVYSEAGIEPSEVAYVETHGTGTKVGDPQEVNGITEIFCKNRKDPLPIGSVKSNMGHSEPASGLCSIAKIVIAMEEGVIPGNLHFQTPNPDLIGLVDGRLKVVDRNTPWNGGYVGVNGFGFGGANVHVILKSNPVQKAVVPSSMKSEGLKIFSFASRTENNLTEILKEIESNPKDKELYSLLSQQASSPLNTHPFRGYSILNGAEVVNETRRCAPDKRPVWYVFAGMGSQWKSMGRDMLKLEVFYKSILRANEILKPYSVNLLNLILSEEDKTFESIMHSFVGIAAIQVALVNTLKHLGLEPDGIVGHSVGELGCAYADGCFTDEQAILAAYWRGRLVEDGKLPAGAMAAIGLTWEETKQRCPEGVVPACHNAVDTVTVSGPADKVLEMVNHLKNEGVFAKVVNSAGVAFHCHFMEPIAPMLHKALDQVVPNPKPRTSRWVSSSIPESQWLTPLAATSSAAYHVNNLTSPVLFQEALSSIPKNAFVIEVAPHCLLQAILKRSLGSEITYAGLMKKDQPDGLSYFLTQIGRLYISGLNMNAMKLYETVSYPVSRGCKMISPLIKWDHSLGWQVASFEQFLGGGSSGGAQLTVEVDVGSPDSKDAFLIGHKLDGRVLYPATGYMVLAWKALARLRGKEYCQMPIVFENVTLHRATILPKTGSVKFLVGVMIGEGNFEISEGGSVVATGQIHEPEDSTLTFLDAVEIPEHTSEYLKMELKDVYKELRLRGYEYGPTFQGILEADNEGNVGKLKWNGNWISFMDTMLQFAIIGTTSRLLRLPTRFQYIKINPKEFEVLQPEQAVEIPVVFDGIIDVCLSGGVEIKGLKASAVVKKPSTQAAPTLEQYRFVPFTEKRCLNGCYGIESQIKSYNELCTDFIIQKVKHLITQGSNYLPNCELLEDIAKLPSKRTDVSGLAEAFLASSKLKPSLLKVLTSIFNTKVDPDFKTNVYNIIQQNLTELSNDSLLSAVLDQKVLQPCLDVVCENANSHRIKIVEAGAVAGNLFPRVVTILNSRLLIQVDCIATDVDVSGLNSQDLETYQVKTAKWDAKSDVVSQSVDEAHLLFADNFLTKNADEIGLCLQNLFAAVKEGGFMLLVERTENCLPAQFLDIFCDSPVKPLRRDVLLKAIQEKGLELIAEKADGMFSSVFLLRKLTQSEALISALTIEESNFEAWVEPVKEKLTLLQDQNDEQKLWLIAYDKPTNGIIGLINCLRQEPGGNKIRAIFDPTLERTKQKLFEEDPVKTLKTVYKHIIDKDLVFNIYKDGAWGTYRHLPLGYDCEVDKIKTEHAYVNITTRGDLSSLRWIESPLKHVCNDKSEMQNLCRVYYASLNFRDIMLATGKLPPDAIPGDLVSKDCLLGMEFSGRDVNGRRIMGLVSHQGLATSVMYDPEFVWQVPDDWSLEDAATVPVVYTTVYYALIVRGNLKKGESILIHSGSGGVGQAAISVALSLGCEVYTTVGNKDKMEILKKIFPQLKEKNFANSRDLSFEQDIMRATRARGVNVVLNSLAEDKLMASVRCLSQHGRFLEIGKFDLSNNSPLGMGVFLKNVSFHGILLDAIFGDSNPEKRIVGELLTKGIESGAVRPLDKTIFDKNELEAAFRFMATGKHVGKVVLKVAEEESQNASLMKPITVDAIRRTTCHPKKTYVITGGLGGFGLELSKWLVERGAQNLVLNSRSGVRDGFQSRCIRTWKANGINVIISKKDIVTLDGTTKLLAEANKLGAVGGIFSLAMVLKDSFMENQTVENFIAVGNPKINGTHNLDVASRKLCPQLDWFVAFSSVSCGRGNAGQANYGFANSVMERICETRQKDGLPGLAIQWGAIGDVGVILETMGTDDIVVGGTLPQRITSCLSTLDKFLNQPHPVVSSFVMAEKQGPKSDSGQKINLVEAIANVLGIKDVKSLSPDVTLAELGMDSLMGVEIKHALERNFDVILSMNDIRQLSIKNLNAINNGEGVPSPGQESSQKKNNLNEGGKRNAKEESMKIWSQVRPLSSNHNSSGNLQIGHSPNSENGHVASPFRFGLVDWTRFDLQNLIPAQCVVPLNSVTKGSPLFILHPIEGSTISLITLANKLACPVFGVQCTATAPLTSVDTLAAHYIKQIQQAQPEGPYRLAGYSFGATAVFEMATQLQAAHPNNPNIVKNLILLDGSHCFVTSYIDEGYRSRLNLKEVSQGEVDALCTFMLQFTQIDYFRVKTELVKLSSWDLRVQLTSDILMKTGKFKRQQDIAIAANFFHKLLLASYLYSPTRKYTGDITLIRALENTNAADTLGPDYGLKQVCSANVNVHTVEGDHDTFILGSNADKCANIMNAIFDR